jgi:hypothetical protein
MTDSPTDPTPVSWRTVTYGTPVTGADGVVLGVVAEMLGSDSEDIFHGVRLRLKGGQRDVLLSSELVTGLASDAVQTGLSAVDAEALPTYVDEATYHLASVGWLRKHLGWTKDSGKDEEPG